LSQSQRLNLGFWRLGLEVGLEIGFGDRLGLSWGQNEG